jgi:hypothetical protein
VKIQVNSDKNVSVDARMNRFVRGEVNRAIGRFRNKLTRVEVHLSDVNGHKRGVLDKRCLIEARSVGRRPLAVRISAARVDSAVRGSLLKMQRALETHFGRASSSRTGSRTAAFLAAHPRSAVKKAVSRRPSASRVRSAVVPRKRSASTVAKPAKRAVKRTVAKTASKSQATASTKAPKRKAIYRARRSAWPKR